MVKKEIISKLRREGRYNELMKIYLGINKRALYDEKEKEYAFSSIKPAFFNYVNSLVLNARPFDLESLKQAFNDINNPDYQFFSFSVINSGMDNRLKELLYNEIYPKFENKFTRYFDKAAVNYVKRISSKKIKNRNVVEQLVKIVAGEGEFKNFPRVAKELALSELSELQSRKVKVRNSRSLNKNHPINKKKKI